MKLPINMGGHTQFEIRTMLGARFGGQMQYELSAGWFHYSNANFHDQNEALDFGWCSLGIGGDKGQKALSVAVTSSMKRD